MIHLRTCKVSLFLVVSFHSFIVQIQFSAKREIGSLLREGSTELREVDEWDKGRIAPLMSLQKNTVSKVQLSRTTSL